MPGFGKDGRLQRLFECANLALGALAANDVIADTSEFNNLVEDFRITKLTAWINLKGLTNDEGPVLIGLADGSLTSAQIEEAVESTPLNPDDVPAIEQTHRAVWPLAMFEGTSHDVRMVEKKIGWTFNNPDAWKYWAYNMSTGALTTGGILDVFAEYFGVWVP